MHNFAPLIPRIGKHTYFDSRQIAYSPGWRRVIDDETPCIGHFEVEKRTFELFSSRSDCPTTEKNLEHFFWKCLDFEKEAHVQHIKLLRIWYNYNNFKIQPLFWTDDTAYDHIIV